MLRCTRSPECPDRGPIGIVFLGPNDFFVLEKASGQIKRVINGVIMPNPALDLAVNSNSERGLLSMVLHPNFPVTPFAYVRWTESSTGVDSAAVLEVPLLGNRVDRFVWNAAAGTFTFDRNPMGNLLQMDFQASSNASGLFGIFAVQGSANTAWTDSNFTTQFFANVPNGTGTVHIGDVLVRSSAVPEPSSLVLLGLSSIALAGCQRCRNRFRRSRRGPFPTRVN